MKNKRERTATLRALKLAQRLSSLEEIAPYAALQTTNILNLLTHYCADKGIIYPYSGLPQVSIQDAHKGLKIYRAGNRSLNFRQAQRARHALASETPPLIGSLWEDSVYQSRFTWSSEFSHFTEMRLIILRLLKDWLILRKSLASCRLPSDSQLPKISGNSFTITTDEPGFITWNPPTGTLTAGGTLGF